jgi:serine/threonine-protein kinase
MIGQTLCGRYRIIKELGQGAFGTTFVAEDIMLPGEPKPQCVVKQLTPLFSDRFSLENATRLFEEEAKVLQNLGNHPQIPRLLAYFEENRQFYLVQELIDGHNLGEEFTPKPGATAVVFKENDVIQLVRDILEVLIFVQEKNYIHRDIKPANIIRRNEDGKLVLIDFGAVKDKLRSQLINPQTQISPTVCVGTPGYMPLEQQDGRPDFCSDVYAVGMIGIQSLTGTWPHQFTKTRSGEVIWRDRLQAGINYNPRFLNILDKMVRSNCDERYQLASEVIQDLDAVIEGRKPPLKINWKLIIISAAIAALIIGLPYYIFSLLNRVKYINYSNSNYGVKLQHPETWLLEEEQDIYGKKITLKSPLENQSDDFQEQVSLFIQDLSSQPLSLNEYTEELKQTIEDSSGTKNLQTIDTTLSKKRAMSAIYLDRDNNKEVKRMRIWTLKNNQAYVITYTAAKEKYQKYFPTAENIIKSFEIE